MGYCRCTEQLSDVVEHTVLSSGGAIVMREHKSSRRGTAQLCFHAAALTSLQSAAINVSCGASRVAGLFCCALWQHSLTCWQDMYEFAVTRSAAHEASSLLCSGLHETLYMTVAIPLLWGIPPRHESLRYVALWFASCVPTHPLHVTHTFEVTQYCYHLWRRCCGKGVPTMAAVWIDCTHLYL